MAERETSTALVALADNLGLMTEEEGLPRTAGRIFGLLLVSDVPVSFGDLAERLSVSRGGVSSNTRLLIEMGLIERVAPETGPGRQDWFQVPADVWHRQIEWQMKRDRRARSHVEAVLATGSGLPPAARTRLLTLLGILSRANEQCIETLAMLDRGDL
ncbi:GbsR/MarR family transcriptional regulator [Novosphingobium malaysiense]|uniref:GbsR/MarR family transcriptional regulator n=1 Tax=Novosphingobium malaysiense TaxID=1348853 RepID=UPI00068B4E2B|nr:MarR family transcriptional regulator [Novosphingobium malaysiense]